ncbi:hypothetical protein NXS08_05495 [Gleimia sp. 6138-11-ORH1]|uniref:hypothetical protein n=1 Tax=Gleimia sp. 6138-11-ORH1 TaxID=2973937 RepID=UPI0021672AA6|nr:hypothetical protein [Gleimia sp. 6138-11-ORH1]MCS4484926.1 hypothetical protein [Gleimia sp. 6138-11-ORH1]
MEMLILEKWLSRGLLTVLVVTATAATTVLTFGEYIVFDLLKVDTVKYAADPGEMIHTVLALLAAIGVIFSYLVLQFRKNQTNNFNHHAFLGGCLEASPQKYCLNRN